MSDAPILTVCIPCYNAQHSIGRTIESLVEQQPKLKLLIIDDGSSDHSGSIIDDYASRYDNIRVIHQKNRGIAAVRNRFLDEVDTPYIGFLDADDQATSDYSRLFHDALKTKPQMVCASFNWITSKKTIVYHDGPYEYGKDMLIHLFNTLWNKVYDLRFIKAHGIHFPDGNRYEDTYFLCTLAPFLSHVVFIKESVVDYIQTHGSITHTNNQQVKNMIDVFQGISDWYDAHGLTKEYHDELEYMHIRFFLGSSFLRSTRIDDKKDRKATLKLGWDLLNQKYPHWHHNKYLKSEPGLKNKYFRMVYSWNYYGFAMLFRWLKKDQI